MIWRNTGHFDAEISAPTIDCYVASPIVTSGDNVDPVYAVIYAHRDLEDLAKQLEAHRDAPRKMIITDGVFSMDGDLAPLVGLVELAEEHDTLVVVDDAHGTGVIGEGRGTAHHFGVADRVHLHMGTLGKALGSFGAFVATTSPIRELLINRARSLIYSTAPPPAAAGAALAALALLEKEPEILTRMQENAAQLRAGLRRAGFQVQPPAG